MHSIPIMCTFWKGVLQQKYHWTREKATMTTQKVNLFSPLLNVHPGYQTLQNLFPWRVWYPLQPMCRATQHLYVPSCSRQGKNGKYNLADLLLVWSIFKLFLESSLKIARTHGVHSKNLIVTKFPEFLLVICKYCTDEGTFGQNEESATKIFLYVYLSCNTL